MSTTHVLVVILEIIVIAAAHIDRLVAGLTVLPAVRTIAMLAPAA